MTPEGSWKEEFEQLNRKIDGLSTLNEKLVSQVVKQSAQLSDLGDQNKTQSQIIDKLSATINELKQTIASKDARISELEERLNKNSGNSSKPSSSDFFNKPKPSSINKGERGGGRKKRSGGQKGHAGSTLKLKETPDVVHRCVPADCIACKLANRCAGSVIESRNVVDVRIVSEQSRYDRIQRVCLKSGKTLAGSFPEGVNTHLQYGSHLKAMVVALSSFGMVSASRICELVEGLAGIRLSDGTVCNILSDCAGRCNALVPELKQHVIASDTAHFDETGIRVNGKVHWAHTSSTDKVTLISAHPKRGAEGILAGGVLQQFPGVAIHDCCYFAQYFEASFARCAKE